MYKFRGCFVKINRSFIVRELVLYGDVADFPRCQPRAVSCLLKVNWYGGTLEIFVVASKTSVLPRALPRVAQKGTDERFEAYKEKLAKYVREKRRIEQQIPSVRIGDSLILMTGNAQTKSQKRHAHTQKKGKLSTNPFHNSNISL